MILIPNFIGYCLDDAERELKNLNIKYVFSETSSPRKDVEGNEKRIVRQVVKDEIVYITFCRY